MSCGINDPLCWTSQAPGERSDPPVAYGDIDSTAWGTTAIDDLGTTNNEVVHRFSPLASQAALCGRRADGAASSCGMPIATATGLYGSAQGEETQHAMISLFWKRSACCQGRLLYERETLSIWCLRKHIMPVLPNDTQRWRELSTVIVSGKTVFASIMMLSSSQHNVVGCKLILIIFSANVVFHMFIHKSTGY